MCTLTFAWRAFEDAPVVVAANRDEALDRSAVGPARIDGSGDDPVVIAPRDERAGGTWIGTNEHGVFVGITNRWTDADLASERSRGLLVRDALAERSAAAATATVETAVAAHEYDGFNLVVADAEDCNYLEWDGDLAVDALDPGVHVVVNVGAVDDFEIPESRREYGEQQAENARAVRDALQLRDDDTPGTWRERAAAVLGDHDYGVCIHGDGYGTRSSSLIQTGREFGYWHADGAPCETEYERVDATFDA
ncbi:NRDE family protein [Halorubellus sp. PRR65]|uniref:NRDE family protein n=1 Tax=Halorubellus sp. PRR65 TaxID=3098148 RepID=UPI002B256B62|nr:NRDE family protein [Halorubellus sp. PRR65]